MKNDDEKIAKQNLDLAIKKLNESNISLAIEILEKNLNKYPDHLLSNFYLGNIFVQNKDFKKAKYFFNKAIEIKPNFKEALNNLGTIHMQKGDNDEAKKYFEKSIIINSNFPDAYNNIGILYKNLNQVQNAEKNFLKSIEVNKNYLNGYINLMQLYERLGENEKLYKIINKAETYFNSNPIIELYKGKAFFNSNDFEKTITTLKSIKFNKTQTTFEKARCLTIAKSYDKIENIDSAFEYFNAVNEINYKFKNNKINKNNFLDQINLREKYFNKNNILKWSNYKNKKISEPVFMIGFPRSGTTLLDNILRSHPSISVIEEKPLVEQLIKSLNLLNESNLENINKIDENNINLLRKDYLRKREGFVEKENLNKLIIDKMPLNMIYIGEILRIFPNAKFIFSLRHPCDCVLSCFMQNFALNDSMSNFLNLEDAANLYAKVMLLWTKYISIFSFNYYILKYEDLVNNLENSLKQILNFLEINWNDSILDFNKTVRNRGLISTPSYDQVSKPIYSDSIGRWKKYEKKMSKVIPILNPWIKKFNY